MKAVVAILAVILFSSFSAPINTHEIVDNDLTSSVAVAGFKLINDTGKK